ncbi:MAG: hypothetical protein DMG96_20805 [Acidobacteria bacterium]|nr:MAG: hypothetical protein DMG96_20805 [Acidobacteriota bacterium]
MPYKNPEDKRRWEREHREQRDAQRKKRRLDVKGVPVIPQRPTPTVANETKSGSKMILGLARIAAMQKLIASQVNYNGNDIRTSETLRI